MKKNEVYELDIIDNGINFEGIAKYNMKPIFINNAIKGDKVSAKILKVNKNFSYGKIEEFISKSINREESICDVYNLCGGCNAMHMSYDTELKIKEKNVLDTLYKNRIFPLKYNGINGMGMYYNYRNKVSYPVRNINGVNKIGFYKSNTHQIIENDSCHIQNQVIDKLAKKIFNLLLKLNFTCYNEETKTGDIKHIVLRRGYHTEEILVTIVVTDKKLLKDLRFEELKFIHDKITSVYLNLNKKSKNNIFSKTFKLIHGKEYITDYIDEYKFHISPSSFFQVNTVQTEILYNILKKNLDLKDEKILFDLYSGVGSIGIFLSKSVNKVYGIEIDKKAVDMANLNISLNNLDNLEYVAGSVEDKIEEYEERNITPDVIVVDPPRKGLDEKTIEYILKFNPKKIGYVSCNYASLARDLKMLENSYTVKELELVDMFPRTKHVECVVVLEKLQK